MGRIRNFLLTGTALAGLAIGVIIGTSGAASTAQLGLWNNGTPASTLGVTPQVISDYAYGSNSTTYTASGAQAAKGKILMLGVGALNTAQAVSIGTVLEQNGQANAIIRPMWEMNQGGWFVPWNERTFTAAQYKAEWITIVNGFRSVAGGNFKFDYDLTACSGSNISGRSNFDSFPGTTYANYIGIDVYDNNGSVAASQACINADATFAQSVGLPMTIPEWGLSNNVDDPAFVNMIYNASLNTYEQALFSEVGLTSGSGSDITKAPNSLAAYKADFGGTSTTTTTTTVPATTTTTTVPPTTTTTTVPTIHVTCTGSYTKGASGFNLTCTQS